MQEGEPDPYARAFPPQPANVQPTCLQSGSTSSDLATSTTATTLDVIGQVYSEAVKREMNELVFESKEHSLQCKGYVSGANYSAKRGTFIFFINRGSQAMSVPY